MSVVLELTMFQRILLRRQGAVSLAVALLFTASTEPRPFGMLSPMRERARAEI